MLNKRIKELKKEMVKKENLTVPVVIIIKKIMSLDKMVEPRLKVFENIRIMIYDIHDHFDIWMI